MPELGQGRQFRDGVVQKDGDHCFFTIRIKDLL